MNRTGAYLLGIVGTACTALLLAQPAAVGARGSAVTPYPLGAQALPEAGIAPPCMDYSGLGISASPGLGPVTGGNTGLGPAGDLAAGTGPGTATASDAELGPVILACPGWGDGPIVMIGSEAGAERGVDSGAGNSSAGGAAE